MARFERRRWESEQSGMTRRDRRPCNYEVYWPDPLAGRRLAFEGEVAAEVAAAEHALTTLNAGAGALSNTEALARLLLRAESVASSRIEGLEIGGRRLLRAAVARQIGDSAIDVTATEVLGNIEAMLWGLAAIENGRPITPGIILEVHRRLLEGTRMSEHAGQFRTVQNWIGGSSYNPCSAAFVPPPPEAIAVLLDDLCTFCNDDALPPLAQAAIAHAQFETIHPFVDGNGRTGRTLLHLVLRRRGLANRVLPPVSLILATRSSDYVAGLTATRYVGDADSPEALAGMNRWVDLFAAASHRAIEDAARFEERVRALQAAWNERAGNPRADSAVTRLIDALPAVPVLTTATASTVIGRSFQATSLAIERLVAAGVLAQINIGKRNRAFEAPELIDAFTALERQLASPEGDTRVSEPARRVPRRN